MVEVDWTVEAVKESAVSARSFGLVWIALACLEREVKQS